VLAVLFRLLNKQETHTSRTTTKIVQLSIDDDGDYAWIFITLMITLMLTSDEPVASALRVATFAVAVFQSDPNEQGHAHICWLEHVPTALS